MPCARIVLVLAVCSMSLPAGFCAEPLPPATATAAAGAAAADATPTVAEARRQARALHVTVHAALQLVHHRYYREDEGLKIPAATLREVFAELEKDQQITLRWLAVEGQAMNEDHKPRDAFEHAAVEALKKGQPAYELAEPGRFRRAAGIRLSNSCLKCHVPDRKDTKDRTAGLIVSIPLGK